MVLLAPISTSLREAQRRSNLPEQEEHHAERPAISEISKLANHVEPLMKYNLHSFLP